MGNTFFTRVIWPRQNSDVEISGDNKVTKPLVAYLLMKVESGLRNNEDTAALDSKLKGYL